MTDTANIQDRRARPSWMVVWTGRVAPAVAGVISERIFTNESVSGFAYSLGISDQDARSALIFAVVIALTSPSTYVDLLCTAIVALREFFCRARTKLGIACNEPIEGDNE